MSSLSIRKTPRPAARLGLALLLGLTVACGASRDGGGAEQEVQIDAPRFRVALFDDDQALGGEHPLVTVVLFSDYACPPCATTWRLMDNLVEDYGDDLRVVWRSYTVPGFGQGERAADAALAAAAQGKFWPMHRRLFAQAPEFDRPTLRAHAEAIGLDVPRFLDDLDAGLGAGVRLRHRRQALELGVSGLPVIFVNGLYMVGAQRDEAAWHALLDAEIARARKMIAQGTPRAKIYGEIMRKAAARPVPRNAQEDDLRAQLRAKQAAKGQPKPPEHVAAEGQRYAVGPGQAPLRGPADAPVVVVEFLDFRCPFCKRAWKESLSKLPERFGKDVAWTVRHYPLEIHPTARGVAEAAVAAARQGKFWEFHDRLMAEPGEVGRDVFERVARDLGLDLEKFRKDLDDPAVAEVVAQDQALGRRLGVPSTPGFFVNGRFVRGYTPGALEGMIEDELQTARAEMAKGVPRAKVAELLISRGTPENEFPNP